MTENRHHGGQKGIHWWGIYYSEELTSKIAGAAVISYPGDSLRRVHCSRKQSTLQICRFNLNEIRNLMRFVIYLPKRYAAYPSLLLFLLIKCLLK